MAEIVTNEISVNRYAPEGANSVCLYNTNGCENITFGQLVMAVCIRQAATYERSAVIYENRLAEGAAKMEELSAWLEELLEEDAAGAALIAADRWKEIRAELIASYGCSATSGETKYLPESVTAYGDRMEAYETIRTLLNESNSSVDRLAIELQTEVSRRDTAYNMATQCTTNSMKTMSSIANCF